MHVIRECPICAGKQFRTTLSCKDTSVSHETFQIKECQSCRLWITDPQPENHEQGKYYASENYISHSDKIRSPIDLTYRISRVFTTNWKLSVVRAHAEPKSRSILDLGCGAGTFLKKCLLAGYTGYGVEPSPIARKLAESTTGMAITTNLEEHKKKVDIITAWHVIEHVPSLKETFESIYALLSENGTVFIAVPNHESPDALTYKENWAGLDVPRHLWHFSKSNMIQLLELSGFQLVKILPMKLDAYYVSLLSEKNINGALTNPVKILKGLLTGLRSNLHGKRSTNQSSLTYIARKK